MKILHLTPSYKPAYYYGGPTVSVSQLCEHLALLGHSVSVMTTTANGPAELRVTKGEAQQLDGVLVHYFSRWTGDHSHFSHALLLNFWRHCRSFDIVHIHSWWNLVAVLGMVVCRLRGIRPVVSLRGMLSAYTLHSRSKRLFHRVLGETLLRSAILHVTSLEEWKVAAASVPKAHIFCLPNLVNLPACPPKANATPESVEHRPAKLLFLGRIHPIKRLELLFQAVSLLSISYRLTIAGAGDATYLAQLRTQAEQLGIAGNLEWSGWVEGAEKSRLLAASDVFVLTSHHENFANAALEALAMGTPAVLTETVGLAEYVRKTGFGLVCPADAQAIGAALAKVALNGVGHERQKIATQVRSDFDPVQLAHAYLEQYRKHA